MAKSIQRLNYHTGLFLEEDEFILEQYYHLMMRRRLNYALFTPGVLYGLELDYTGGVLTVTPGLAIDEFADPDYGKIGREIVLLGSSSAVDLSAFSDGNEVWITIKYKDEATNIKAPTNEESRITETYEIEPHGTLQEEGADKILLGSIVKGTDSHAEPVQKAVLRLGGAPSPAPTISNFSPLIGDVGTTVIITGTNFTGATEVSFGGVAATSFSEDSPTQITATVPAGAVTGKIGVTTPAGFGESVADFTVSAPVEAPTIDSFDPTSGGPGTEVIISGDNFTGAMEVSFGEVAAATFTVDSDTVITAEVPVGAVTGKIRVTGPGGVFGESAADFTVVPAPVFLTGIDGTPGTQIDPHGGVQGTDVFIFGRNFSVDMPTLPTVELIKAGAVVHEFNVGSVTQHTSPGGISYEVIEAKVQAVTSEEVGKIRVTTSGGSAETDETFGLTII